MSIRTLLNRYLQRHDLEIRGRFQHARRHSACMDLLLKANFRPRTVIDVGVARGTPWLYEAFPDAKLVLIDPNPVFREALSNLQRSLNADAYFHALGAQAGEAVLQQDQAVPGSSSLLAVSPQLTKQWANQGVVRTVSSVKIEVQTLDDTLRSGAYEAPFVIKIDTEGYEREVLLGAAASLEKTDVVIVEASVMRRFEGSYEFADLIRLLDDRGFRLYDLLDVRTFGRGGPINYLDAAFVRRGSPLFPA